MKRLFFIFFILSLQFSAQQQLTNFGNLMVHSGTLTMKGDFRNDGNFIDSAAQILFNGPATQQISGTSTSTFKNLALNNSSGLQLGGNAAVSRELLVSSGTFSTNGFQFTILSNANGTGRIAPLLGDITGSITVQRYLPPGNNGWRFLASPVTGATINDWQDDFITSGFPGSTYPAFSFTSVYTYDESVPGHYNNGFVAPSGSGDALINGKGYWCYIGPVPLTFEVTGPAGKFSHNFPVTFSSTSGPQDDGWVMIGNPYASSIDWSSPHWTKTNINNAVYIWNPSNQQFATWINGTGVNGGSNIIASSQSFWVQANGANPVLTSNENVKTSTDQTFLRSSAAFTGSTLKLELSGNGYTDEACLRFGSGATNGYDIAADARKIKSWNPQVPFLSSRDSTAEDLSVNSLPGITRTIRVPIRAMVQKSGTYTISINTASFGHNNHCLVLEDLMTGLQVNLSGDLSQSFFLHDTTTSARFLLHIVPAPVVHITPAACHQAKNGIAAVSVGHKGYWQYSWKDDQGNIIRQQFINGRTDTLKNLGAGNYYLELIPQTGVCTYEPVRFEITEPLQVSSSFHLHKDTLLAGDTLFITNTSLNSSAWHWDFGDKKTSKAFQPQHTYGSPGLFLVSLKTYSGSCADSTSQIVTVVETAEDLTGINELQKSDELLFFPNPGTGIFYLRVQPGFAGKVEVYNITGQLVHSGFPGSTDQAVDLSHLAKGMYSCKILTRDGRILTGKIVIQ